MIGFLKKLMFVGVLGVAGWGMYHAGENDLFSFMSSDSEEIQVVKKDRAVKSRSFFKKIKDVVPAPLKQYDYTFFETLEDVDLDRYVDLDGKVKVMKKTVHSWVDEVEKVIDEPHILLASYKEPDSVSPQPKHPLPTRDKPVRYTQKQREVMAAYKKEAGRSFEKPTDSYEDIIRKLDDLMKEKPKKIVPPVVPSSSAKRAAPSSVPRKAYRVQVSSFRKLSHARKLESDLRKKGYSPFVVSVQVSPSKGRWYRVFLGDYPTEANARAAAKKAKRLHKMNTIVLKASR